MGAPPGQARRHIGQPTGCFDQRLLRPGAEIVPPNEPIVVPATVSYRRSMVKLPEAFANRPVPPVMVAVSSMSRIAVPGIGAARPVVYAVSVSPFAAVIV